MNTDIIFYDIKPYGMPKTEMPQQLKKITRLRVIDGGLHCKMMFNGLQIVAAPEDAPPFKIDALAVEEDTYLIMSAEPTHAPPAEHPLRFLAELARLEPEKPGSIVVRGHNPVRLMAVVHDVNKDPTWREKWIKKALCEIFKEADIRRLSALGLPLIGTKHGKLKNHRFAELLAKAMKKSAFNHLKKLWIIAPVPENVKLIQLLKNRLTVMAS